MNFTQLKIKLLSGVEVPGTLGHKVVHNTVLFSYFDLIFLALREEHPYLLKLGLQRIEWWMTSEPEVKTMILAALSESGFPDDFLDS